MKFLTKIYKSWLQCVRDLGISAMCDRSGSEKSDSVIKKKKKWAPPTLERLPLGADEMTDPRSTDEGSEFHFAPDKQ